MLTEPTTSVEPACTGTEFQKGMGLLSIVASKAAPHNANVAFAWNLIVGPAIEIQRHEMEATISIHITARARRKREFSIGSNRGHKAMS